MQKLLNVFWGREKHGGRVFILDKIPMEKWIPKPSALFLNDQEWKNVSYDGPEDSGEAKEFISQVISEAVAVIDDIPTCQELIEGIISKGEQMLENFKFLKFWKESGK